MTDFSLKAWQHLGRVVHFARIQGGLSDTKAWSERVGRSTRMLLGLERGERVGRETLVRVEAALGWAPGRAYQVLAAAERGHLELPLDDPATSPDEPSSKPGHETVRRSDEARDFVATGSGGEARISDEEVLVVIRETRQRLDELERRLAGGGS